jgi:DNA/RNA endonuclease YhcR with UshA esterase domain
MQFQQRPRADLKSPALSGIEGKHVKITGRIEMYKGKPETRIDAASQIVE